MESAAAKRSVALELAALGTAALLFVATFRVRPAYVDPALAALAVMLIIVTARRSSRLWQRTAAVATQDARAAAVRAGAFTLLALAVLASAGVLTRGADEQTLARFTNWHFLVAVPIYFLWAVLQQFIFQFYLLGRLLHVVPRIVAIALTAMAFASVHYPRGSVMALTFVAGLYWSALYVRYRNLWVLAASHAVLGAALHYWVFGRDLLVRWLGA